jgi:hypothetical protein
MGTLSCTKIVCFKSRTERKIRRKNCNGIQLIHKNFKTTLYVFVSNMDKILLMADKTYDASLLQPLQVEHSI